MKPAYSRDQRKSWIKVNPITLNHDSSLPPATLTPMCYRATRTTGPSGPEIDSIPEANPS